MSGRTIHRLHSKFSSSEETVSQLKMTFRFRKCLYNFSATFSLETSQVNLPWMYSSTMLVNSQKTSSFQWFFLNFHPGFRWSNSNNLRVHVSMDSDFTIQLGKSCEHFLEIPERPFWIFTSYDWDWRYTFLRQIYERTHASPAFFWVTSEMAN